MIFAHGPLGFLIAAGLHKRARKAPFSLTNRQWYAMLVLGFVGGIFPDVDLFFFYFVNAATSHREFLTHTPFLYIVAFAIFAAIAKIAKKPRWILGGLIFTLGTLSHLLTDGVAAKIMYLYPLNHTLYGVQNWNIVALSSNVLFLNFLMEGIFITLFFYIVIRWHVTHRVKRIIAVSSLLAVFAAGVLTITIANQHVYHDSSDSHYGDIDNDGIPNYSDPDIDGDGTTNVDDLDADNDGKSNAQELIENAGNFIGVWYDPTEGGLAQIPARLGLITNHDLIWRLYESIGVNIQTEMTKDFLDNPEDYKQTPASDNFDRNPENIFVWLEHTHRLQTDLSQGRDHIGDILFFNNNVVSVVSGFTNEGQTVVLDVHKQRGTTEKTLTELVVQNGPARARGSLIDPSPLFSE